MHMRHVKCVGGGGRGLGLGFGLRLGPHGSARRRRVVDLGLATAGWTLLCDLRTLELLDDGGITRRALRKRSDNGSRGMVVDDGRTKVREEKS